MKYPPTETIKAKTLPHAWGMAVPYVLNNGMIIGTQYGNRSRDACITIEITHPYELPMMHPQFPTKELHTQEYLKQWERGYGIAGWIEQGFEYNYMNRLINHPKARLECDSDILVAQHKAGKANGERYYNHSPSGSNFIDQIAHIRDNINKGVSRRLQATTWIADRDLFVDSDQPCLQRLWLRNLGDGNAELHSEWRSRDLYAAWNSNMVGLLTMVKREILDPNKLTLVKVVDFCNSLHIYEADWEAAALIKPAIVNPMLMR